MEITKAKRGMIPFNKMIKSGKSKAWISLQISTCPAKNAVWVDVSVQYFTVKYPCGRRNRNINNTNRGRNSKSTNLQRQRSHMLIPASRI